MNATIAVVIPSFDRVHVLARAVDSVLAQTSPADECIVVDDGSSDGTSAFVRRRFPDVTCLRQSHRGVSAARNLGIGAARSHWIAFLDSDDCWMPDKLALQRRALAGSGRTICHSEEIWIRRGRRVNPMRKHRKRGGWIYRDCLPRCALSPSTSIVRRDLLEAVGGFDESLPACEDYDLWLRLCARQPVELVGRALVTRYGGHDDQLSARHWGMDRFRVRALEKMLATPHLAPADRRATLDTLVHKLEVLVGGARKRGNLEVMAAYGERLAHYRGLPGSGDDRRPPARSCRA